MDEESDRRTKLASRRLKLGDVDVSLTCTSTFPLVTRRRNEVVDRSQPALRVATVASRWFRGKANAPARCTIRAPRSRNAQGQPP